MNDFKKGDVVALRSGSPNCTVASIRAGDKKLVDLYWYDGEYFQSAVIPAVCLVKQELKNDDE